MLILGIESSCDESSIALVENGKKIYANEVLSQIRDHAPYWGVVPELASRKHLENLNGVLESAFRKTSMCYSDVDAVGVVYQPGLIGSLLVGLTLAKTFAFQYDIPLVAVNHIEAHLYAPHIEHDIPFPNIGLVVSGGHTLLFDSVSYTQHSILGSTVDDAVGECFDKVARFLGLGYPGGPLIDHEAKKGDPNSFRFPKPRFKKPLSPYQWSYSGLKSSIVHHREKYLTPNAQNTKENLASSFQKSAIDALTEIALQACQDLKRNTLVVSGGVACNSYLRESLKEQNQPTSYFASPSLCTDNAAMVAGLAYWLFQEGKISNLYLDATPKIPIPELIK